MLKTKYNAAFDLKSVTPQGVFTGLLSPYSNLDMGGDVVMPGSFTKNLAEQGNKRPLLWQHQHDVPLGSLFLEDRPDGLWARGELLMKLPEADKAYELMKAGVVTGLSIGYRTVREEFKNGVRQLLELILFEGSLVTMPMNELAQVSSVKAFNSQPIEKALSEFKRDILAALERK